MTSAARRAPTVRAPGGMVSSADQLATQAGMAVLARGGSAVDAAIAANAALAVTHPHMCGPGGDLFALVHDPTTGAVTCLDAAGAAGSGADLDRLRAEGRTRIPLTGDLRAATVPGCVDGWAALHGRHGRLPLADVLAPAVGLAEGGFPASPLLALLLSVMPQRADDDLAEPTPTAGQRLRSPSLGATLSAIGAGGRDAFYGGRAGVTLTGLGGDVTAGDLEASHARWVDPISVEVWGHRVWTVPPPSQGYLTLGGAGIAARLGLAPDGGPGPDDPAWPHLLTSAVGAIGRHRPSDLHDGADPATLLDPDRLDALAASVDLDSASSLPPAAHGDTTYLCAVDADGLAVSLIQSLAGPFGCQLAVPGTGVWLQNRGIGFSLDPDHPAAYGPGRRPPHTLSPALVTGAAGDCRAVLGTQGGDAQPFVVLQLLARLLTAGHRPGEVLSGPRALPHNPTGVGFDLWDAPDDHVLRIEADGAPSWAAGLGDLGYRVEVADPSDGVSFGHAHLIERLADGQRAAAADPRTGVGSAAGL